MPAFGLRSMDSWLGGGDVQWTWWTGGGLVVGFSGCKSRMGPGVTRKSKVALNMLKSPSGGHCFFPNRLRLRRLVTVSAG